MNENLISKFGIHIVPKVTSMYVPPMVWKGDVRGHIGMNDTFFWIIEGECFLNIDGNYSIVRPGQLAFLPKGKMRSYTQISSVFTMYEISFSATVDGKNLMKVFGASEGNYVVTVENREEMSRLFENSYRAEFNKNPLYDVMWCANIINIITTYCDAKEKQSSEGQSYFREVIKFMQKNLTKTVKIEELSEIVYMQPTYFIRKFKKEFGVPPLAYFNQLRIYKAMEYLADTDISVEEISNKVGVNDSAYFSRFFKKFCNVSPSEYRKTFRSNR